MFVPWFSAPGVGAVHLDAVLAAAVQMSCKWDCMCVMTDLHQAHRRGGSLTATF